MALTYLAGWLYSTTGISLMLVCSQGLLSCLVAISSSAPSVILTVLGNNSCFSTYNRRTKGHVGTAESLTFEKLLLHLILHELNFRELGSIGLWRKRNVWATSLNTLFYPLFWQGLEISSYVSFLCLCALCDAIQWWQCFDAWKTLPGRKSKYMGSGFRSPSLTLSLCTYTNSQGSERSQKTLMLWSVPWCVLRMSLVQEKGQASSWQQSLGKGSC